MFSASGVQATNSCVSGRERRRYAWDSSSSFFKSWTHHSTDARLLPKGVCAGWKQM